MSRSSSSQRILLPDILRGLSLIGILCVNMQDFSGYHEWEQQGIDAIAQALIDIFANGRFVTIFAILFGWGATGLLLRHNNTGKIPFLKRQLSLLIIGILHAVFLWDGDILATYAIVALLLLGLVHLRIRGLLIAAGLFASSWLIFMGGMLFMLSDQQPRTDLLDIVSTSSYWPLVIERFDMQKTFFMELIDFIGWNATLFCIGAAFYKSSILHRPQNHIRLLRGLAIGGSSLGLILGITLAILDRRDDAFGGILAQIVRMVGGLAGGLGYIGLISLAWSQWKPKWLETLVASGRIGLSNYLGQSLVMTTLFYGYAGNQAGWGAAACLLLAICFGLFQVWLSKQIKTGPMEWLMRRLVYGNSKN